MYDHYVLPLFFLLAKIDKLPFDLVWKQNQIHLIHERPVYEKINVNYHKRHYIHFIDM